MTCVACKVSESIIIDEIIPFIINNNVITILQQNFAPGKSCQSNLLSMLNILTDATKHNHEVDLVSLDFAKAFNSAPHKKLVYKLEIYGISGQ